MVLGQMQDENKSLVALKRLSYTPTNSTGKHAFLVDPFVKLNDLLNSVPKVSYFEVEEVHHKEPFQRVSYTIRIYKANNKLICVKRDCELRGEEFYCPRNRHSSSSRIMNRFVEFLRS